MSNEIYRQEKESIIWKLENTLRGVAFLAKESKVAPLEEKQITMKLVEEFLQYIRDYDRNIDILAKYKDMEERLIDDGK